MRDRALRSLDHSGFPAQRAAAAAAIALVASALASCNYLGPAAYLAMGQPKKPAQYELIDRPTVVFVDDRMNAIPINSSRVRRMIADKVTMQLMTEEVLTTTIEPRDAMATARNRDRDGSLMSIEAIGQAVGAEQVIYVEMTTFRGSPDGFTPRATGSCTVKVVDAINKTRLFPPPDADKGAAVVQVVTLPFDIELFKTSQGRSQIEAILAEMMGDQVAKLFYPHVPDEIGSRLNAP